MPELPPDPVEELVRRNRERGIMPDWRSGIPLWRRDGDIPWEIEGPALEAVLSSGESDKDEPESRDPVNQRPESRDPENGDLEASELVEVAA